ncbi:MAG: hypothetical protein AAFZ15_12360 [Bacteroidota bacterium]
MNYLTFVLLLVISCLSCSVQNTAQIENVDHGAGINSTLFMLTLKDGQMFKENTDSILIDSFSKSTTGIYGYPNLPIIGVDVKHGHKDAIDLIFDYVYIFEVPEQDRAAYMAACYRLNKSIDNVSPAYGVLEINVAPTTPYAFNELEAINAATKKVAGLGMTVLVHTGNYESKKERKLSPWSVAPWVIGVGSIGEGNQKNMQFSPSKIKEQTVPTVLANGMKMPADLSSNWNLLGKDSLPEIVMNRQELKDSIISATPAVADLARSIIYFLMQIPVEERFKPCTYFGKKDFVAQIPWPKYPVAVKLILEDMARHEEGSAGAGIVNDAILKEYFKNFNCEKLLFLTAFLQHNLTDHILMHE